MAGSRLDFNTGRIVDPNESAQTHVNAAATIIGNLSKQYLDKQQHEERMAESRMQQADAKDRFAQEMAFNRDKWKEANALAQAEEGRNKAEYEFKMGERAKAEDARKAMANFGNYMDTTASAAFEAEKPKAAQTVANIHTAKIVADLEARGQAAKAKGDDLTLDLNRDTIKAMQALDAAGQQTKALITTPNDLVLALAKDRATDNPKLKRDAFLHLTSQNVPAADAAAYIELQDKLAGSLSPADRLAANEYSLKVADFNRKSGESLIDAGQSRSSGGAISKNGAPIEYRNDWWGFGGTSELEAANDVRSKLQQQFPTATAEQIDKATFQGIASVSDLREDGSLKLKGNVEDALAKAVTSMTPSSTSGGYNKDLVNKGVQLVETAAGMVPAISTVGMTQAEKEANRVNEIKGILDRQFGTPAGDASRYAEYQRSLPTTSTTNKPTEAVKAVLQAPTPLNQNSLVLSVAETGKVTPDAAKAYGEQLIGNGVSKEAVGFAMERAIAGNNPAPLLALSPEYNIKRKDDWLGQLGSWLDRGSIKDEYYTVRNNVLAKALENNATIEQAKAIADADPDVSALAARMANASNIAADADAVRRMQTLPAHNVRGLLKQVAEDKVIKKPDNYRSIMGWAINK